MIRWMETEKILKQRHVARKSRTTKETYMEKNLHYGPKDLCFETVL